MTRPEPLPDVAHDAVLVVPGIMGSKLCDAATGETLWGFGEMHRYLRLWRSDSAVAQLMLTKEERNGEVGRIVATDVLRRVPGVAPILQGFEQYTNLLAGLTDTAAHPDAVRPFPYDWRLSVEHNSGLLARAAWAHLNAWREHPASRSPEGDTPKLVIVAHSMGGLLARALPLVEGSTGLAPITPEIRATVTLGTPFRGAAKTVVLLATGEGTPIKFAHRDRMRRLARTLPGVYDLLPTYPCIEDRADVRAFTPADAVSVGGDDELAARSREFHERLADVSLIGHHALVGTGQPTFQGLSHAAGIFTPLYDEFVWGSAGLVAGESGEPRRRKADGDGTVPRYSAELSHDHVAYLPQQHGPLMKTREGVNVAVDVFKRRRYGPRQGGAELGIEVPDVVEAGTLWPLTITGVAGGFGVRVLDALTADQVDRPSYTVESDDRAVAMARVPRPGVFRVEVTGGGASAVTQLVMGVEPDA